MSNQRRLESGTNRYHIMSRGVGRCLIFEEDRDREQLLMLIDDMQERGGVTVHAWCLMDNHYHLLVESELMRLSRSMRHLNSTYALYFNERHGRSGHLFQGRFRSEPIDSDDYYLTVLRYIHQNPLRAGLACSCAYPWSSFVDYMTVPRHCSNHLTKTLLNGADEFSSLHDEQTYERLPIDVEFLTRGATSDQVVLQARAALGSVSPEEVSGLCRERRDAALRKLKDVHLSVRQIERLTGVPKSIVARA